MPHVSGHVLRTAFYSERESTIVLSTCNISRFKSQSLNVSCLFFLLTLPNPLKPGVKSIMKTTTAEWSANLLPTNLRFILEIWRYVYYPRINKCSSSFEKIYDYLPLMKINFNSSLHDYEQRILVMFIIQTIVRKTNWHNRYDPYILLTIHITS